jgi:thiol-disulfide isomerase/thioredoxin
MVSKSTPARRRFIAGGVLVVLIGLLLGSPSAAQRKTAHTPAKQPAAPPAAKAINADELKALLKRAGDRPLLVNWWATWCDPCRDEFPDLVKIDSSYRAKGLDFIAISLDDLADINTEVPKFLRQMKATMPVYLLNVQDPEPAMNFVDPAWGGALPATFLYNSKGQVAYKHFGRIKTEELRAEIEKLVGGGQWAVSSGR